MFSINLGIKSVVTEQLYGNVDPTSERDFGPVRSMLFGKLLERSVTEHYKSDLYHDAIWLEQQLHASPEPIDFLFLTREWGTHIGWPSDESNAYWGWYQTRGGESAYRAFYVRLWNTAEENNTWSLSGWSPGVWMATFVEVQ